MRKTFSVILMVIASLSVAGPLAAAAPIKAEVAKKSAILKKMHKKAEKALVNAAQDKAFSDYYTDEAHRASHKARGEKVALQVQSKFNVEEMCFIDATGPELSRIVGKEIANDLSPDESGAIFFGPAFASKHRTAYTSPIYMSPDANKWVVAYVTPVLVGKEKRAILHYEHGLDSYQAALNKGLSGNQRFLLAVNSDGFVVSDSRNEIPVEKQDEADNKAGYFETFTLGDNDLAAVKQAADNNTKVDGYEVAYQQVGHWTLIGFGK